MVLRFYVICLCFLMPAAMSHAQFALQGPGVDPADFRVTTFASGLNFPVGMAPLDDGSILVATSNGNFFGSSSGNIVRLVDNDGDGVSDETSLLVDDVPGGVLSSLRVAGDLVFTTGQKQPISIYRLAEDYSDPMTLVGSLDVRYPSGGWLHPHSALQVRELNSNTFELYFQLGSKTNFDETTTTATLNSDIGGGGRLNGDALYRLTITDDGNEIAGTGLVQIATGLRNAAGMAFHPTTGDLFLQDNGIDGLSNPNEPHSADELNIVPLADLGSTIVDFGFPETFTAYRTDEVVGDSGTQPLVAFQPIDGAEAEGPNDIAFAPNSFPDALSNGVFVSMHGKFSQGGVQNEENPLVFVDLEDNSYFHFIGNDEPDVGHLDGLITTSDSLFAADISPSGGYSRQNEGKIYQITSLVSQTNGDFDGNGSYECADLDALVSEIAAASNNVAFDLTGDGVVTVADRDAWLAEAGAAVLAAGGAFLIGDTNLNGEVNSTDLGLLLNHFGATSGVAYCGGDLNADSNVDSTDLGLLLNNFGLQTHSVNAVPEPNSLWICSLIAMFWMVKRR